MNPLQTAERCLREGDPALALQQLQEQVRLHPENARLRTFLFQLLVVLGQWQRALTQLELASSLDAAALAMTQVYREAIQCEALRAQVFAGRKSPMILGQPEPWLALLIESLLMAGSGHAAQSEALRAQAYETADAVTGAVDGTPFRWIADADSRLGPVLEAIIAGKYYWVPFAHLSEVTIEAPADLRDMVWLPAQLRFHNGGESVALIPSRYPGSEQSDQPLLALSRKTEWREVAPGVYHGLGQRILATDACEAPLLEIRHIILDPVAGGAAGADKEGN
jgi:type VI secretion system protein ImpE